MKKVAYLVLMLIFIICSLEITLRFLDYKVYSYTELADISCTPSNWIFDSDLGYCNRPGHLSCSISELKFNINHNNDFSRATSKKLKINSNLDKIHVYGCSITWGHGLNDKETMAWILQDSLQSYNIYNYGIGAGSNVQSYLLLKKNINSGNIPNSVILNYSSFHNMRNSFNWTWRKVWQSVILQTSSVNENEFTNFKIPYSYLKNQKIVIDYLTLNDLQNNLPFVTKSVLMNKLNNVFHNFMYYKNIDDFKITFYLLKEIKLLCDNNDITLILNGLTKDYETTKMLNALNKEGVLTNDISLDFYNDKSYNLEPFDKHPNEKANVYFAKKTLLFFKSNKIKKD